MTCIELEVDLFGDGQSSSTVVIRSDDDPTQLAQEFVQRNGLQDFVAFPLSQCIRQQQERLLQHAKENSIRSSSSPARQRGTRQHPNTSIASTGAYCRSSSATSRSPQSQRRHHGQVTSRRPGAKKKDTFVSNEWRESKPSHVKGHSTSYPTPQRDEFFSHVENSHHSLGEEFLDTHHFGRMGSVSTNPGNRIVERGGRPSPAGTRCSSRESKKSSSRNPRSSSVTQQPKRTQRPNTDSHKATSEVSERFKQLHALGMRRMRSASRNGKGSSDLRSSSEGQKRGGAKWNGPVMPGTRLYQDAMKLSRIRAMEKEKLKLIEQKREEEEIVKERWRDSEPGEGPYKMFTPCINPVRDVTWLQSKPPVHVILKKKQHPPDFRKEKEEAECTFKPDCPKAKRTNGDPQSQKSQDVFQLLYRDADERLGRQKYAEQAELEKIIKRAEGPGTPVGGADTKPNRGAVKPHVKVDNQQSVFDRLVG